MTMKILEGLFTIAFVSLILTHSSQFVTLIQGSGRNYAELVRGLQGR